MGMCAITLYIKAKKNKLIVINMENKTILALHIITNIIIYNFDSHVLKMLHLMPS